ncbi:citrate lyase acyl carrier protein [Desulfovibrio sp. OttesenSCG-928-I05]|nr:citrate lyase acyl carrier protein [Desulfovibrio sp. OttesenSCG-928-I05]
MGNTTQASAGTLESNDILVVIAPGNGGEATVSVESIVMKQFGPAIIATIQASLAEHGLGGVTVTAQDKGALDCTIKARMEAAILRYKELHS